MELSSIAALINDNYRSNAAFARKLGVDKSMLSRVLAGKYRGNSQGIIDKIMAQFATDDIGITPPLPAENTPLATDKQDHTLLDLFSGIGAFSLGLERAGFKTVAFCEVESVKRRWLSAFWPTVPKFDDIRELTYDKLKQCGIDNITTICGGFPCQDISCNGKGAGLAGQRSGLWSEYLRLIAEISPRWVIIENVERLRSNGLAIIMQDLWSLGYDAEWHIISAANFGYLHQRERLFIIAYPAIQRLQKGVLDGFAAPFTTPPPLASCSDTWIQEWIETWRRNGLLRATDGFSSEMVKWAVKGFGNALVPEIPQYIGLAIKEHEQRSQELR